MTSQNHIRQTFVRDWEALYPSSKAAWIIKGDFDHFKLTNDLYGPLITDYLLDWTIDVIEAQLRLQQKRWGCEEILCSVTGDDVTIYIPPAPLDGQDIRQLLVKIRVAVRESFWRRYVVGTLPIPAGFFDDIPSAQLKVLRSELEALDVVLDFAPRERGFLALLPVAADGRCQPVADQVLDIIRRRTGKPTLALDLQLDWVCSPDDETPSTFNKGFIDPPSVSFAACSTHMAMVGKLVRHAGSTVYQQISTVCQATLKTCKQQRLEVLINQDAEAFLDILLQPQPAVPSTFTTATNLHWCSERYLRETLYFRQLDRPVLFQFNPVYSLIARMPAGMLKTGQYRGNTYGIGLKGINEIYDQYIADNVIRQLMSLFSRGMAAALVSKGISPERIWLAQFVDRFTVYCEQPIFQLPEIVALIRSLAVQFNTLLEEIKISYMRTTFVSSETPLLGYRLFNQLTLTSLSSQSSILINAELPIEVRQNSNAALEEGRANLERSAFLSASLLNNRLPVALSFK